MNKPLLIGSRALEYITGEKVTREDSDWDFIGDFNWDRGRVEIHPLSHLNNSFFWENTRIIVPEEPYDVCSIQGLKAIKRSHLHRPAGWDKHITHYHRYLSQYYISGELFSAMEERKRLTYDEYGNKHPNLSQSNEDFFDDKVEKVFDHDYLHELYAYHDRPLFERLKRPGEGDSAWCNENQFSGLDYKDKVRCVAEECYVIATERFLIPAQWDFPTKKAYYMAVRKVCTTLTSGWFRDFAINAFPSVMGLYSEEKFNQVRKVLQ